MEQHSPMQVHWSAKWISFFHLGKQITLQGLTPSTSRLEKISVNQLQSLEQQDLIWCVLELFMIQSDDKQSNWPFAIQELISEFSEIFNKPT